MTQTLAATSAAEFWQLLSPEKPLFPTCSSLYRGQANASWGLEPSILRSPDLGISKDRVGAADSLIYKEWTYLKRFVESCDSIGLPIPNDSKKFRESFETFAIARAYWSSTEFHGLLALAQHHNVPTGLLDWSTRSYVAAYFAISDALERQQSNRHESDCCLAVWVLDFDSKSLFKELKIISVPGGNNPNLAAQSGKFTLLQQEGSSTPLDRYFLNQNLTNPPLKKVTLPISEARSALELCYLYGVTGATPLPKLIITSSAPRRDRRSSTSSKRIDCRLVALSTSKPQAR